MDIPIPEEPRNAPAKSGQVLGVRHGRGRTGGSTLCDLLIQRARRAGRPVIVGDGDRRNATLANYYPPGSPGGALQPPSDETADVKDWITWLLGDMVASGSSLVLDLGGGDRVLGEYGRELALPEFCDFVGLSGLALYLIGPDMDDFDHILAIHRARYFSVSRAILVMNESLIRTGKSPFGAFDPITARPEFNEMAETGMRFVFMPRLICMAEMRRAGLTFYEAAEGRNGKDGTALDPVRQFMVKSWLDRMEKEFEENCVAEWLP